MQTHQGPSILAAFVSVGAFYELLSVKALSIPKLQAAADFTVWCDLLMFTERMLLCLLVFAIILNSVAVTLCRWSGLWFYLL